jgi:(E)-4-hydroxy-3-methylbut-2-enyl-diphosphate synthase
LDKWNIGDLAADYVYIGGNTIDFELPGTIGVVADYSNWKENLQKKPGYFPLFELSELPAEGFQDIAFVRIDAETRSFDLLQRSPNAIVIVHSNKSNKTQLYRSFFLNLANNNLSNPVILEVEHHEKDTETFQLWSSSDCGSLLIDGLGDGVWLKGQVSAQLINSTSFGILQATRTRISKTEYISCPSCGRTLFDLQETTAKIRSRTSHLKGIKIGIMGCIVNGPGEMADADYGYVGTGPGKIHLYKEKTIVRKNVAEDEAVDALIELIREHGDWVDPKTD